MRLSNWLLGGLMLVAALVGIGLDRYVFRSKASSSTMTPAPLDSARSRERESASTPHVINVVEGKPIDAEMLRTEVNRAVRDALDDRAAQVVAEKAAAAEAKQTAPSARDVEAVEKAESVLNTAIAARRWTPDDRDAFDQALLGVSREQRRQVMQRLLVSINNSEIPYTPRE